MIHSGKKVVVLGLGHSGAAAAKLLFDEGADVTALDSGDSSTLHETAAVLRDLGIRVILGPEAENDPARYDLCVISPGIDPIVPLAQNVLNKKIPVIGELELAFEECNVPVVAITGTNGKTTTTELTTAMLQGCGVRTMASGNIGLPFAEAIRECPSLDVMVLETSSFQLETVQHFHPKVAAWLNLSPNHLDRYQDVDEYRDAKLRIFERQTADDFAVVNAASELPDLAARKITFSAVLGDADFTLDGAQICFRGTPVLDQSRTQLHGIHNAENLMAALGIGLALDLEFDRMAAAVMDYTAPAHRCEPVRELDGVLWVNDSKATNLDAMEKAILSQNRPVVLVAGGKDKGFGFEPIADLVRTRAKTAILIGEMRHRIADAWSGVECVLCDDLEAAVASAQRHSAPGDTVLFSPGTSSFDMFRNYGERGNQFKALVQALT